MGRNVLVPSCYPTLLIIVALSYKKSMVEVLSRMLNYVTQCWLLPIHRTSSLRSRRHSHREILEFFFSSTLLKLSAETEKNSNKLVLPIFFTILFISLALFLVSVTQTSRGSSDENGFNGGHGHMTWMDVCDREDSALNIAHYRKFILTKFYTVKQTLCVFTIKRELITKWTAKVQSHQSLCWSCMYVFLLHHPLTEITCIAQLRGGRTCICSSLQ